MAFEVKKIDPLDLQPRKAVGVKLPFSGRAVFNSTFTSKDAIKTNLINYFLTGRGERFLNPTFGNSLRNQLFENITEDRTKIIDRLVRSDLELYFPRVKPSSILTEGIPDSNTIQFSMTYQVLDTNIEDEVIINFEQ